MLTCTSCGNIINEGDKFCQYCGTLVVHAAPSPAPAPAAVCTNCGSALEAGDNFCQICGTPASVASAPAPVVEAVQEQAPAASKKLCVRCGNTLAEDDKFCQVCGEPAVSPEPAVIFTPAVEVEAEPVIEVAEETASDSAESEEVVEAVEATEEAEEIIESPAEVEEVIEEAVDVEAVAEEEVLCEEIVEEPAPEVLVLEIEEEEVPEAEEECECVCEVEPMGYDFPYLLRRKTRQIIDVNKAFFRIGSEKNVNNYVLEGVGGMHAMLMTTAGKYYIVDLGTEGKTYVNGAEIAPDTEVELTAGCAIRLADEDFVFIV